MADVIVVILISKGLQGVRTYVRRMGELVL